MPSGIFFVDQEVSPNVVWIVNLQYKWDIICTCMCIIKNKSHFMDKIDLNLTILYGNNIVSKIIFPNQIILTLVNFYVTFVEHSRLYYTFISLHPSCSHVLIIWRKTGISQLAFSLPQYSATLILTKLQYNTVSHSNQT